jgi:HSP20 family protein
MAKKAVKKTTEKAEKPKAQPKAKEAETPAPVPEIWRPLADLRDEIDRAFDRTLRGWPRFGGWLSDWSPFREMDTIFGKQLFGKFPPTDIDESDKDYTVSVELPGLDAEDVDLAVTDDMLTIKGEKKSEREEEEKGYHLTERSYGSFERSFRLPEAVDAGKIDATFDKGVLKIVLPKRPEALKKARKITVTARK